jgi:hypothetical protein
MRVSKSPCLAGALCPCAIQGLLAIIPPPLAESVLRFKQLISKVLRHGMATFGQNSDHLASGPARPNDPRCGLGPSTPQPTAKDG